MSDGFCGNEVFSCASKDRNASSRYFEVSQELTLQKTANEFMVYLNNVEHWRQRRNKLGLSGLYKGRCTRRPKKWRSEQR